jgi:4-hydroxy-tetrahydrodipicolinate synthase
MTVPLPGVFCCLITPFDERGELDEPGLAVLAERVVAAGVGLALGTASPGEGHSLSLDETERLYRVAKETAGGRVPVIAMGCEPRNATEFLRLVRIAERVGLDAVQLYSVDIGHGNYPSDEELERYFRTMLEGMAIPARLSSHQAIGYNIPLPVIGRLLDDYPHIEAVHCISDNLRYLRGVIEVADGRAGVFVGGPHQVLTALAFGGQGYLDSTCALLAPRLCASIIGHYNAGRLEETFQAYARVMEITAINRWAGIRRSAGGMARLNKAALHMLGLPGWHLRPPYMSLDGDEHRFIADTLKAQAIPELEDEAWLDHRALIGG